MIQKVKVVIVDDEPQILEGLTQLLDSTYNVIAAAGGEEAIELIKVHRDVAVIISDQRMPIMKGVDLLRVVRQLSPETVRILLTGYADLDAILDSVNVGEVFRYVRKPWVPETLKSIVASAAATHILRKRRVLEDHISPLAKTLPPKPPKPPELPPIEAPKSVTSRKFASFEEEFFASLSQKDMAEVVKFETFEDEFMTKLEEKNAEVVATGDAAAVFEKAFASTVGKPRILIVDDEPEILASLMQLLSSEYEVLTSTSADEALGILEKDAFVAVILSDQRMPKKSGAEFLIEARQFAPAVPKILITAYTDVEDIVRMINEGQIFRYLQKPWSTDRMMSLLKEAVAEHQRRLESALSTRIEPVTPGKAAAEPAEKIEPKAQTGDEQNKIDKLKALSALRKKQ